MSLGAGGVLTLLGSGILWLFVAAGAAVEFMPRGDAAEGLGMGVALLAVWALPVGLLLLAVGLVLAGLRYVRNPRARRTRNAVTLAIGVASLLGYAYAASLILRRPV